MGVKKILVIDDSPTYANVLKKGFEAFGISTNILLDSRQSVEEAKRIKPDFIILDIMMPNQNGFEVCRKLKTCPDTVNIPIIFISAKQDADSVIKSLHVGCIDYIKKPVNMHELIETLIGHEFQNSVKVSLTCMREKLKSLEEKYANS